MMPQTLLFDMLSVPAGTFCYKGGRLTETMTHIILTAGARGGTSFGDTYDS